MRFDKQFGTLFTIGKVDDSIFVSLRVRDRVCDSEGTNSELVGFKGVMLVAKSGEHEFDVLKFDVMVGTLLISEHKDVIE